MLLIIFYSSYKFASFFIIIETLSGCEPKVPWVETWTFSFSAINWKTILFPEYNFANISWDNSVSIWFSRNRRVAACWGSVKSYRHPNGDYLDLMAISVPNLFIGRALKLGRGCGKPSIKLIFISICYDIVECDSNHGFNSPLFYRSDSPGEARKK